MSVLSFDVLFLTITFLVPGYVIQTTLSALEPRRSIQAHVTFLRFLTLSAVHNAAWATLLYWLYADEITEGREHLLESAAACPFWVGAAWFGIVLISPFVFTVIYVHVRRAGWTWKAWNLLGLRPMDPVASAWDFGIHRMWEDLYLIIRLTDGSTVYAKFGEFSHFGSEESGGGLHLEQLYEIDEDGTWVERAYRGPAITIPMSSIHTVEFWGTDPALPQKIGDDDD